MPPGSFWGGRLETNRRVTAMHNVQQCEETGRVDNLRIAAGLKQGYYDGLRFDDSDVYKTVEGLARVVGAGGDTRGLEEVLDVLIGIIAKAQLPDGYIHSVMQVEHPPGETIKGVVRGERWAHERESHETYCMGHLIEAGVAHFKATGKTSLLDVARKAADRIVADFGPGRLEKPSGHQQIEIGLAKLAAVTGDPRYLDTARFFLDQRGRLSDDRRRTWSEYFQDHKPVAEQDEAVGHAVRAAYQYAAMADIAAATDAPDYRAALDAVWRDVVESKLYLTGGIGGGSGEGFSGAYELPNLAAYNETCSSIANILWQQRVFLLGGDADAIEILERCLYNSFLSGVSLRGDRFFYPNKLASVSGAARSPWFRCACCPPNVLRFIPQTPTLLYAVDGAGLHVNLYAASEARVAVAGAEVEVSQQTRYPWDGDIRLELNPDRPAEFALRLRLPGWLERPFPSDLYRYRGGDPAAATVTVNGEPVLPEAVDGYAVLKRTWEAGDVVTLELPMPVRMVVANEKVAACRGRVALMRGPIVYAAEGVDNGGRVHSLVVPADAAFTAERRGDLLDGVTVLRGRVQHARRSSGGDGVELVAHDLTAIPYYAWAHRGRTPMRVWLATAPAYSWPESPRRDYFDARATSSKTPRWQRPAVLNDGVKPFASDDRETPSFCWSGARNGPTGAGELEAEATDEQSLTATGLWVRYEFDRPRPVSSASLYWAVASKRRVDLPRGYALYYRDGGRWRPIAADYPAPQADTTQSIAFPPVTTDALMLKVRTKPGRTAGLYEWEVE